MPEATIEAIVDRVTLPGTIHGWAIRRVAGALAGGLRIEVKRGDRLIAAGEPRIPRPDVTNDPDHPAGFVIECGPELEAQALLEGALSITVVDEAGRSQEYGARIIDAVETGTPCVIYGNVPNAGLIANLPEGCCVEVPCLVDHNGVQPVRIGALPPQLAALMQTNVNVQALTVEAALTGRRDHVLHAAMLDPHTAAELSLDDIARLVDAMLEAHRDWLPPALRAG